MQSVLSMMVDRVRGLRAGVVPLLLISAGACNALDDLLSVELPGSITAEEAQSPAKAAALASGGITLFNCTLLGHIVEGATLGDELTGGTGGANTADNRSFFLEYTLGTAGTGCLGNSWGALSAARWHNENTLALLQGWSDQEVTNRSALMAQAAIYAGYSLVLMAERFCTGAVDGGPELSSAQLFDRAEDLFAQAITTATAASNQDLLNLARSGRARTRLGLGRLADAASDAALVPQGYLKNAEYPGTAAVNENGVYTSIVLGDTRTIDPRYRDMRFNGVPDPRVVATNTGRVTRWAEPLWIPAKYPTRTTPIRMASWQEAQLIIAENRVRSGDASGAVAIINALHAAAGIPSFASDDAAEVLQQVIYERRAEFFFEGQHIGDFRRLELPLIPAPGTPYYNEPNQTWGSARCFPLPNSERSSNPNLAMRNLTTVR